jgi:hypothetical protein
MQIGRYVAVALLITGLFQNASAAQGEMGIGTPVFAVYGNVVGNYVTVWSLTNATISFPTGCNSLQLYPATMGIDAYKAAIAMMLTAKATNAKIRFYAHLPRDGGCGVDYVQVME